MGIPITDTSAISKIPEWSNITMYDELNSSVRRNGAVYIVADATANVNKDPALAANKAFWTKLTTNVFEQEEDPTSTAGGNHAVTDGDRWINFAAIPSGTYTRDTAPLTWVRKGTNWTLVNSGTVVLADADAWGTVDKSTTMVIVEKHITHPEMPEDAIDLGFKSRGGNWMRAKLWQMPWGQIHKYSWSGDFYAWDNHNWHRVFNHAWNSGSDSVDRLWKVTVTINAQTDANGHNSIYKVQCNGDTANQSLYINSDTHTPRQLTFVFFHHSRRNFSLESVGAWQSNGAALAKSGFVVVEDVGMVRN